MTTTVFSQLANASLDTAIAGTSMNALADGSYALGAAIDNRPTSGSVIGYDMGDLTITLSSAVTAGSGAPYVQVWILPAVDATNYPTPPGGSAGNAPMYLSYSFPMVASTSTSTIICPDIPLPPYLFKVMLLNKLGVPFPSTNTSTCQLQRKMLAGW